MQNNLNNFDIFAATDQDVHPNNKNEEDRNQLIQLQLQEAINTMKKQELEDQINGRVDLADAYFANPDILGSGRGNQTQQFDNFNDTRNQSM